MSNKDKHHKGQKESKPSRIRNNYTPKAGPNSHPTKTHNVLSPEHYRHNLVYLTNLYLDSGQRFDEFMFAKMRELGLTVPEVENAAYRVLQLQRRRQDRKAA